MHLSSVEIIQTKLERLSKFCSIGLDNFSDGRCQKIALHTAK